jgi:hypothetical protein
MASPRGFRAFFRPNVPSAVSTWNHRPPPSYAYSSSKDNIQKHTISLEDIRFRDVVGAPPALRGRSRTEALPPVASLLMKRNPTQSQL